MSERPGPGLPAAPPEARTWRLLVGALAAACAVTSVVSLQSAFDAGDRRRALAALEAAPAGAAAGAPLVHVLRERNGGAPPRCWAEVMSGVRGITRVACAVAADPVQWRFLWDDLKRDGLRPEDEATRRRLGG